MNRKEWFALATMILQIASEIFAKKDSKKDGEKNETV